VEKVKVVSDKNTEKYIPMRCLLCKVNDDSKKGMNGVDIADQLCGSYQIGRWMYKQKWWWAIWMWGVQLLLVIFTRQCNYRRKRSHYLKIQAIDTGIVTQICQW
jgi:hypothetical protein